MAKMSLKDIALTAGTGGIGFLGTSAGKKALGADKQGMEEVSDANQQELINMLMARSRGENSLAQKQTTEGLNQNLKGTLTGIRGMGGINNSLQQRMMANAQARTGSQIAQQGAMARMAEANEAQNTAGQVIQGRSQVQGDLSKATRENRSGLWRAFGQAGASAMGGK